MRASDLSPRVQNLTSAAALLSLALAGCGRSAAPVTPTVAHESALRVGLAGTDSPPAATLDVGLFFPLDLGNHWVYDHDLALYVVPTGGPPGPAFGVSDQHFRDLVCVEERGGNSYVVERQSATGTPAWWVRYRQDRAGLYEADVDVTQPPTCSGVRARKVFDAAAIAVRPGERAWNALAAKLEPANQAAYRAAWVRIEARAAAIRQALGVAPHPTPAAPSGVAAGEITRLEYPLHPGAHWVIRSSPLFESTVEGADALDLPPGRLQAWRIRIDSEFFGPSDRVHVWYSRSGYLQLVFHAEDPATDQAGNVIGTVIADETEKLAELSLTRGRFASATPVATSADRGSAAALPAASAAPDAAGRLELSRRQ